MPLPVDYHKMQQRRGTTADWTTADPILLIGEIGLEVTAGGNTIGVKIGNGTDAWSALPYVLDQTLATTDPAKFASLQLALGVIVTAIRDEDDMVSDDASALATQQSIKAYVDDAVNSSAGVQLAWAFDTDVTATDPGAGNFKYDNATPGLVTNLYVSSTAANGADMSDLISALNVADHVYLQQADDPTKYMLAYVNAEPVDNTGWWTINVIEISSGIIPDATEPCGWLIMTTSTIPAAHAASHTDGTDDIQDATNAQKGLATAAQITKLDGIEALADVTDTANVDAAGATMNADTDVSANAWVLDEDNMASDDATKVPTQQSVKAYVDGIVAASIILQGDWNASTNTPDITGTTTTGYAWRVSVAGSTDLGGITDWTVGDLAVKTATGWLKIDNDDVAAVWGNITGTLSNQTDLQSALDAKQTVLTEGAFVDGDKTKLDGIETGAEVNNISDVDATDLTDGGETLLHTHPAGTPGAHAATHQDGGADEVATATPAAAAIPKADGAGKLDSWISDASTTAKGLVELAADLESAANLAVQANDGRLTDARTPTAHAASHQNGGSDELSVAGLSGLLADAQTPTAHAASHTNGTDDIQDATAAQRGLATAAQISKLDGIEPGAEVNNISDVDATDLTDGGVTSLHTHAAAAPAAHVATHENGGADELNVDGLSGLLAEAQTPLTHGLGGPAHSSTTLDALNSLINDLSAAYGAIRDIGVSTLITRPAPGVLNRFWWTTDERRLYRDTSTVWELVVSDETDPVVGAINGIVKADGAGNISAAVEDTDYQGVLAEGPFVDGDKTKLDGIEALADVTDTANVDAAGATMNTDTTLAGNGYFLDEDNMASNDATKVASQQSIKAYVDAVVSAAVILQGDWDADTNTPDITGTTTTGYAWRVSVAGATNLGGITDWAVGDLAVKTAASWIKIDNGDVAAVWGNISGTLSNQTDLQSALDAKQNILSEGAFVDGDKTKLDGIEAGAEVNNISDVNATDLTDGGESTLHYHDSDRARANHTGTQLAATISDFDTEVANNTDVAANSAHRTNTANPHATDLGNLNSGTLAELNALITDLIATYGGIRDIGVGTLAQLPTAGTANRFFWTTDEQFLYRDNGTSWDAVRATGVGEIVYLTYDGTSGTATGTKGVTKNADGDWSVTLPGQYYIDPTGGDMLIRIPDSDADNEGAVFTFRKPNLANNDNLITFRTEDGVQKIAQADRFYMFHPGESAAFLAVNFVGGGAAGRKWRQTTTSPTDKPFQQDLNNAGSPYSITHPAGLYYVDSSAGDVVVNLGALSASNDDREARFMLTDATNSLIVNANTGAGDTIGGVAARSLTAEQQVLGIIADLGSQDWRVTQDTKDSSSLNVVYVSKLGSDTYGDGTLRNPYNTIKFAVDSVTGASAINPYVVEVAPGYYVEQPITMKSYVDVRASGGPYTTTIAANAVTDTIITAVNSFTLAGFAITGATSGKAVLQATAGASGIIKDCVIYNCATGIEATAGSLIVINLATAPVGSITNFIYANGGFIEGTGCVVTSTATITNVMRADGSASHIDWVTLVCDSPNVTTVLLADEGAFLRVKAAQIEGATNGAYAIGAAAAGRIQLEACQLDDCTNGLRVDELGHIDALSCIIESTTWDLLAESTNAFLHLMGCQAARTRMSFPQGFNGIIAQYFDTVEGDQGIVNLGEFAVGRPEMGSETIMGEGDSYTRGMAVLTTDGTATSTTEGGNLTDVSADAGSASGSTFSFQGVTANHTILVGSTLQDATDVLKHWGLKIKQTTAAVEVTPKSFVFEYWNGAAWTEFQVMATHSSAFDSYGNVLFIRANSSEHVRYGLTENVTGTDWAKKTIDSKNLYWTRIRIATTVTTAPVFEQFKLHSSRFEANATGFNTYHGRSRFRVSLTAGANSFGPLGGVGDVDVSVGSGAVPTGWTHKILKSEFGGDGDSLAYQYTLPKGIDTSLPLYLDLTFGPEKTGTSQAISLIASMKPASVQGVLVADPAGGTSLVARTLANTDTVTNEAAQTSTKAVQDTTVGKPFQLRFGPFDVSDYYEGDLVFLRLELDDNGIENNKLYVFEFALTGVKWKHGDTL